MGSLHLSHILTRSDCELVGCFDPDPQRLEVLPQGIARTTDFSEALSWTFDTAVVAAPTQAHAPTVLPLLAKGVHTLVEKPIAGTVAQAREMVDAAKEGGLALMVGHIERHNPMIQTLARLLETLPPPRLVSATRLAPRPGRIVGDGIILDSLIHDVDILAQLFGKLTLREGVGTQGPDGSPDAARLSLRAGDTTAHLFSSWRTERRHRTLSVLTEDALLLGDYIAQTLLKYPLQGGHPESLVESPPHGEDNLDRQLSVFLERTKHPSPPQEPLDGLEIVLEATESLTSVSS